MKNTFLVFFLLLFITGCALSSDSADNSDENETAAVTDIAHSKSTSPDFDLVFNQDTVQNIYIQFDNSVWSDLSSDLTDDYSDYVECTLVYNDVIWEHIGIKTKLADTCKIPFKLSFDEFEDNYTTIKNQRLYGFKKLILNNNSGDLSEVREVVANNLFRDFGVPAPHCAFYKVYVDIGDGNGNTYFGLYTLMEAVDDTVLKNQFANNDGNLYKPEGKESTFKTGAWDATATDLNDWGKETNEDEADYSDIAALYDAIQSSTRTTDISAWKFNLESNFNVPVFLKWLAATTVMQNRDTYGNEKGNYYIYNDPSTGKFTWIPWDNDNALEDDESCLSFSMSEVTEEWPLINYILNDETYYETYKNNIKTFAQEYFTSSDMESAYTGLKALINDAVAAEKAGYSFTTSSTFGNEITGLINHAKIRTADAVTFANQ